MTTFIESRNPSNGLLKETASFYFFHFSNKGVIIMEASTVARRKFRMKP